MIRWLLCVFLLCGLVRGVFAQGPVVNIAYTATVAVSPAVEGDTSAVVDGNPASSLTFALGTSGEGSVNLSFDHPRQVSGLRFFQSSDVYYTTRYVVEADLEGKGDFGRSLATGDQALPRQWTELRWEPVAVRALRLRSLAGVSKGRRAHPVLGEIEVLGVAEPGDVKRATERGIIVPKLAVVRPLRRTTPLVVNGRGPAVLLPSGAEYETARLALLRGLATCRPEVVKTIEQADPAQRTVVCLGSLLTNPLLERLYWNHYTYVDALTPGPGNYLVHTVYDPYPWSGGQDVIVIGCSDAAGALPAVEAFLKEVQEGARPYGVTVGPKPLVGPEEAARIAAGKPNPTFEDFTKNVKGYLSTGCEAYAKQAVATLEVMAALYAPGGRRSVTAAHDAAILPWNEETTAFDINLAWDAFEENPLLSDDLRLQASNAFLKFTRDLVGNCSDWSSLGKEDTITWNHTTFPLLGTYGGARYFQRYYGLADMPEKLSKARACFLAQARSWKPEEDSDSYLTLTMMHTAWYCLAENELDFFRGGNMKRYADYMAAICDNRGLGSGFGDSGLSSLPSIPMSVLPLALWWTHDGGYRWLMDHYSNGTYQCPWDRGLTPAAPERFCGLNLYPLDPQVYAFHQRRPSYNEKLIPAEVTAAEAFDKLTFRESWAPDAQYLILDGFGRGKHLHYDTNALIEFVEGGERWLLDHDYLVRNTTEHTMLTVLRDGRADTLVPSMAGLSASADLPGLGYSDSFVKAYNGCDWRRQLLWARGECFVVTDTVTAREAGSYDLELTWKTLDENGRQYVTPAGDFVAERGVGLAETADCTVLDDATASGGKALVMDRTSSRIAFGVDLPAGEYALGLFAAGVDSSSDSLWVSVDLGPNVPFHVAQEKYAVSSSAASKTEPTPKIKLAGKGPHLVVVTPRENPPVRVDRFEFTDARGQRTVYEAESLPAAPSPDADLGRWLHIKPLGAPAAWVTTHERVGISAPIALLHQRQSAKLQPGQPVRFTSLVYTSLPARRRELAPLSLAENLVALQGSQPALALLGRVHHAGLEADVAAAWLSPQRLSAAGLRRLTVGDLQLKATPAVDLELDLKTGDVALKGGGKAQLEVRLGALRQKLEISQASHRARLKGPFPAARVKAAVEALVKQARPAAQAPAAATGATAPPPLWTALEGKGRILCLKSADLHDGQGPQVLVGRDQVLTCLGPDGKPRWRFTCQGLVRDVAWADLRPAPGDEIVIACGDAYLYVLSSAGELLEKKQLRGTPWARSFGDQAYAPFQVGAWDLNGDGRPEIAVTLKNFDVQVLDKDLNLLWKDDYALHGSTQLGFEDTTGDGKPDTLFIGDKYGSVVAADATGKRLYQVYTSIGDVVYAVGDVDGDGKVEVVGGSSTGDLVCTRYPNSGEVLWRFDNFGYPVNRLRCADVNGDGKAEVLVASGTGYLYVLDGSGQVLWQDRAGLTVNDVLAPTAAAQSLAYADESGLLCLADGQGKRLAEHRTDSPPRQLAELSTGDRHLLLAALADGRVVAWER